MAKRDRYGNPIPESGPSPFAAATYDVLPGAKPPPPTVPPAAAPSTEVAGPFSANVFARPNEEAVGKELKRYGVSPPVAPTPRPIIPEAPAAASAAAPGPAAAAPGPAAAQPESNARPGIPLLTNRNAGGWPEIRYPDGSRKVLGEGGMVDYPARNAGYPEHRASVPTSMAGAPDVGQHWGGGPQASRFWGGQPGNIFSMIDEAMAGAASEGIARTAANQYATRQFMKPDVQASARLDEVSARVNQLVREQGDFLRSRRVSERGSRGGPSIIYTPDGRRLERGEKFERTEEVGGLDDMVARLYDSGLKSFASGDIERGQMFGDLAKVAGDRIKASADVTTEGMRGKTSRDVARITGKAATESAQASAMKGMYDSELDYAAKVDEKTAKLISDTIETMVKNYGADEMTPERLKPYVDIMVDTYKGSLGARRGPREEPGGDRTGSRPEGRPGIPSPGAAATSAGRTASGATAVTSSRGRLWVEDRKDERSGRW